MEARVNRVSHFSYLEINTRTFMIIEKSEIIVDKFNHVSTVRSERQAKRLIKLLNALPSDMFRNNQ